MVSEWAAPVVSDLEPAVRAGMIHSEMARARAAILPAAPVVAADAAAVLGAPAVLVAVAAAAVALLALPAVVAAAVVAAEVVVDVVAQADAVPAVGRMEPLRSVIARAVDVARSGRPA